MDATQIEERIKKAVADAHVVVRGKKDHYSVEVVSRAFEGKTRIQQHQMVYKALGDTVGTTVHALALHTSTPDSPTDPTDL